jgi:hypothetical protein
MTIQLRGENRIVSEITLPTYKSLTSRKKREQKKNYPRNQSIYIEICLFSLSHKNGKKDEAE